MDWKGEEVTQSPLRCPTVNFPQPFATQYYAILGVLFLWLKLAIKHLHEVNCKVVGH